VIESLSSAVLKAVEGGTDKDVANEFLEQSDQRFRLKHVLGVFDEEGGGEQDAFTFGDSSGSTALAECSGTEFIRSTVAQIQRLGDEARPEVEQILGSLDSLKGDAKDYALDEIQEFAEQSEAFLDLVNEVLDEIADRFGSVSEGKFKKSSTGWPIAWSVTMPTSRRKDFFQVIRCFAGTSKEDWGNLLTPLVTGLRVRGPFRPAWVPEGEKYLHVYIDTEGLLHAKTTTDVPSELTSRFKDVDTILLVESAKNALHSPVAGKVFEAVGSTGYTPKFALLFTHMDTVLGDNLSNDASKREHVFGGARNVLENQVARNLSRDAARQLSTHLETNTFYLAYLDARWYPTAETTAVARFEGILGRELWRLSETLRARK
jgi:hypothetical protein